MFKGNSFQLPELPLSEELIEALVPDKGVLIERIVSTGQITSPGKWYDQERDEWVILLQGEATLVGEDGKTVDLVAGDYVFIAAHEKHRVERTSTDPACIWLAVHARIL